LHSFIGATTEMLSCEEPLTILLAAWAPFRAGAEVAAERLAVGLREAGHRVTVVLGTDGATRESMCDADLDVRYVPLAITDKLKWWRYRSAQRDLQRLLLEIQPDVVHANDLPTSQMVGQAAAKLDIPRICHHRWVFGAQAIDWLNKFGAERHLFVSRALMDQLCAASPRLMSSERAVVYDGLPIPQLPSDADRRLARQNLGLAVDKQIVLFAGQVIERKGVEDLLRAWKMTPTRAASGAELILIGDDLEDGGRYRRQMESLAAELRCPARFAGFQCDVPTWIAAADVCVVPSHSEPLGNATLEAMAHGRPVIGTNVGGIPEMIVDGETGLLVPPRDPSRLAAAIETLLGDSAFGAQLGRAARRRCEERFSIERHVDAIVGHYREVVAQHAAVSV